MTFLKPIATAIIAVALSCSASAVLGEDETVSPDMKKIESYQSRANKLAPKEDINKSMTERATKTHAYTESDEFKAKLEQNRNYLKTQLPELFGPPPETDEIKIAEQKQDKKTDVITGERVFIFISKSVPEATLRNYIIDASKIPQATIVLRGFVGGAKLMQPTVQFMADLMKVDRDCKMPDCEFRSANIIVDPIMFERLNIDRVPAIAYVQNYERIGYCSDGLPDSAVMRNIDVVYGDVSLRYAMEYLNRKKPTAKLDALIKGLR